MCRLIVPFEVNVILKLTHLPPFPEYTLDLCSFPRSHGPMRPVSMEGLVIATTRVTKYTQGARFLCINDECSCSTGTAGKTHIVFLLASIIVKISWLCTHKMLRFSSNRTTGTLKNVHLLDADFRVSPHPCPCTWSHGVGYRERQLQLQGLRLPTERGCEVPSVGRWEGCLWISMEMSELKTRGQKNCVHCYDLVCLQMCLCGDRQTACGADPRQRTGCSQCPSAKPTQVPVRHPVSQR